MPSCACSITRPLTELATEAIIALEYKPGCSRIYAILQRKIMNTDQDRIAWVDVFKFFGIWAIYIGHFGAKAGKVYPFVFAYHVPMFFFAAGFFSARYLKDTPLTFIKKKTLQLMLPYVFFSLVA